MEIGYNANDFCGPGLLSFTTYGCPARKSCLTFGRTIEYANVALRVLCFESAAAN